MCEHAKELRRRQLRLGLLTVLLFLILPAIALAQFTYTTNNGTITITGYTGPGGNVTIPSVITGFPVTAIDQNAFYEQNSLTGVAIPGSVEHIYPQAFLGCDNLTNVALVTGVLDIGYNAFGWCSNLTSIMIPASTSSLSVHAFLGCTRLAEINVDTLNTAYRSADGVLFDKNLTTLMSYPEGKFVPNYVVPNGVTNIGPWAFNGRANLTGVTLPETLTGLGEFAFASCNNLGRVTLPNSITNIQDGHVSIGGVLGVFSFCASLTNVIVGKDLAYLGNGTFWDCTNLAAVYFQGNEPAPAGSPYIFYHDPLVVVYYLPGTTGWEPTFSQRPTMLWNPQAQTGSLGVGPNGFGFNITGTPDIPIVIEASADFTALSWIPLQTCSLTNGLIYFSDSQSANYPRRSYRIRSP
jgi:hypothetical protein